MGLVHIKREGKKVSGLYRVVGDMINKVPGVNVVYVQTSGACAIYGKTKFYCISDKDGHADPDLELRLYE